MTRLISPAPGGWANLAFGATSPKPYSSARPHQGRDWGYYYADASSRRTVAPASGLVIAAYSDGKYRAGWGNYVDILIPATGHRIVSRLAHHATVAAQVGRQITAGADVGVMGATGETYGQIHLHEELWIDGVRVDPDYYRTHDLPGTPSTAGGGATPFPAPVIIPEPPRRKRKPMFLFYYAHAAGQDQARWAFGGPGFWMELSTHEATVKFKAQIGMEEDSFDCGSQENWDRFKRDCGGADA